MWGFTWETCLDAGWAADKAATCVCRQISHCHRCRLRWIDSLLQGYSICLANPIRCSCAFWKIPTAGNSDVVDGGHISGTKRSFQVDSIGFDPISTEMLSPPNRQEKQLLLLLLVWLQRPAALHLMSHHTPHHTHVWEIGSQIRNPPDPGSDLTADCTLCTSIFFNSIQLNSTQLSQILLGVTSAICNTGGVKVLQREQT